MVKGISSRSDGRIAQEASSSGSDAAGASGRPSPAQAAGPQSAETTPLKRRRLPSSDSDSDSPTARRRASLPVAHAAASATPLLPAASKPAAPEEGSSSAGRKKLSAKDVFEVLDLHSKGRTRQQIMQDLNLSASVVDQWRYASQWNRTRGKLSVTLSKMPDYALYREKIQPLANRFNLHSGELPPPTASTQKQLDAGQLAQALEMVIARPNAGRLDGFREQLVKATGATANLLRQWINLDGKLLKPVRSVRNLPGFSGQATRLAACFAKLDQSAVADELSKATGGAHHRTMSTRLLVDVLEDFSKKRDTPLADIATKRGVGTPLLTQFVGRLGVLKADPEKLVALPDYDEHRDALSAALQSMGQADVAARLNPARIPATEFLQQCRQNFGSLMACVQRLARDPGSDLAAEAQQAAVPVKLLHVLFDGSGVLRSNDDIHLRLSNVEDYQRPGVQDMLARIAARHAGTEVPEPDRSLKRIDLLHGRSTIPDRTLLVEPESNDPGPRAPRRLERIYAGSPALVREKRSYEDDRQRQVLRWLSTALKQAHPNSSEVQCYFDAARDRIIVSSNDWEANKDIKKFLHEGGLERLLAGTEQPSGKLNARELRHSDKLQRRMDPAARGPAFDSSNAVFAAIAEGRLEVPNHSYTARDGNIRLHAERRIKNYMQSDSGESLDPARLAGTMRPCGTCASDLELPPDAHRGPFWQTRPSRYGVDSDHVIAQNQRDGIGTSVTLTREGAYTFDWNTDSDSDVER